MKKIVYIDMDNVLVDFQSGIDQLDPKTITKYGDDLDDVPSIFSLMEPMMGAIDGVKKLLVHFDIYVLSTAPWKNPSAWSDKVKWIQKHFGIGEDSPLYKRLIISHHKNLNNGDYLIDDRDKNGALDFKGELILFGSNDFPNWGAVISYLIK